MGYAKFKDETAEARWAVFDENPESPTFGEVVGEVVIPAGTAFEFAWNPMFGGRFQVDFDPGPVMRAGFYSAQEFENTFNVVEE